MIIAQYKYFEPDPIYKNWTYWTSIGEHHDIDSILKAISKLHLGKANFRISLEEVKPGLYSFTYDDIQYYCRFYDLTKGQVVIKESPWKVGLNDYRTV